MTDQVLTLVEDGVGRIRLNRPAAIHALNTAMCQAMLDALAAWEHDAAVETVLIDHAEGRGFCAGGDIRMIAQGGDGMRDFFRTEYRLNHRLFTYPKPTTVVMDGIMMGGGVGLALPCRTRIATENTRFAMPEAAIGLFPDVGGGWYLSRLPGRVGQFLALTGHRLDGAECRLLGLATDYRGEMHAAAPIAEHLAAIDRLFASDWLEDILDALAADASPFATAQLAILASRCPTTLKVALRQLALGATTTDFAEEMAREYAIAVRMAVRDDFREGVRAVIVDKDNAPRWSPTTPEAVTDEQIYAIFAPLPPNEAWTPA